MIRQFFGSENCQINLIKLIWPCISGSNLVWKRRINPKKQIKLKVAVKNSSYFLKELSGTHHNWSKHKNSLRNYEMVICSKVSVLQPENLLPGELLYGYCSSIFGTCYLRKTYSGKHFLVAVPIYVNYKTCKPSRKPLKSRTNEKK